LAELASELSSEAARQELAIDGIGIGVPELVDNQGIVRSSYNLAWEGISLASRIAPLLTPHTRVAIESDVRAAARAEMRYGAGRDRKICVYVNVGSGISYCLCIEGRPFSGANGYAIHFASSPLSMRCTECGAAQGPVVEEIASGPGISHSYAAATMTPPDGAEPVLAAADAGDPKAIAIIGDAAQLLGAALGLTVNMLDPEALVIGGGLGSAEGLYWRSIVAETRAHIFAADRHDMPILRAALGPDAGIIGAALSSA
jgi:glucokinase